MSTDINPSSVRILLDEETLAARVGDLARRIEADYETRTPLLLVMVKGGLFLYADLARRLTCPFSHSLLNVTESDGRAVLALIPDSALDVTGRHVILVEGTVVTGRLPGMVVEELERRGAASVAVACVALKPATLKVQLPLRYVACEADATVYGYGMSPKGDIGRYWPYLATLD